MSYIFDEWKPNLYFLIVSLVLFVLIIITSVDVFQEILISITFLLFGWSFSFAKKIERE